MKIINLRIAVPDNQADQRQSQLFNAARAITDPIEGVEVVRAQIVEPTQEDHEILMERCEASLTD